MYGKTHSATTRFWSEFEFALLLVILGVASRFWLIELPNFKPVAALALLAGMVCRHSMLAVAIPICVMLVSDLALGFYQWQLAICVYLSLAMASLLGMVVKEFSATRRGQGSLAGCAMLVGASILMSTFFYASTNGAVWLAGSWYPATIGGLVECYVAGLPFYRWTLAGDLFFTAILGGSWLFCRQFDVNLWSWVPGGWGRLLKIDS